MLGKIFLLAMIAEGLICPDDYFQYGSAKKCLRDITTRDSREEGRALCEAGGGQLAAVINDEEQYDEFYRMDFNAVLGSFAWSDGSPVNPAYFTIQTGEPYVEGGCYVTRSDKWLLYSKPCTEEHATACQWNPPLQYAAPMLSNQAQFYKIDAHGNLDLKEDIENERVRSMLACASKCGTQPDCTAISYSSSSKGDNCVLWAWADPGTNNTGMQNWSLFIKH